MSYKISPFGRDDKSSVRHYTGFFSRSRLYLSFPDTAGRSAFESSGDGSKEPGRFPFFVAAGACCAAKRPSVKWSMSRRVRSPEFRSCACR